MDRETWNRNAAELRRLEGQQGRIAELRAEQAREIRTCEIVKPGGADPWADRLAGVPDIAHLFAPQTEGAVAYDSMQGLPSPETLAVVAAGYPDPDPSDRDVQLWVKELRWQGYRGDVVWSLALSEVARCRAKAHADQVATLRRPFVGPRG